MLEEMMNRLKIQKKKQNEKNFQMKKEKIVKWIQHIPVLSLGYNCFVKIFLQKINKEQETHFFDWLGSSMWSVRHLLENQFEHVTDKNQISYMHVLQKGNEYVWTHQQYYLRYLHDFEQSCKKKTKDITEKEWNDFIQKYNRRAERFLSTLQKSPKILFIRLEEVKENRIHYPQYESFTQKNEIEELESVSTWIRNSYPNLIYKIIYIERYSFGPSQIDEKDSNILIVRKLKKNGDLQYRVQTLVDIFIENEKAILTHIQSLS